MDKTKLIRQLKKFEEYMMVDKGLCDVTVGGYCRTLSIALRRMRKFVPQYDDVKEYMLWMYKEKYSYSYIVNTCLALEHYGKFKGIVFKLGRPKKPRYLIKDVLSEAEVYGLPRTSLPALIGAAAIGLLMSMLAFDGPSRPLGLLAGLLPLLWRRRQSGATGWACVLPAAGRHRTAATI